MTTASTVSLSPRQAEAARLLCGCLTHDDIADRLGIASRTVEQDVGQLRTKTDRPTTAATIADLVGLGLA